MSNALIENMKEEPEWWVKHLMANRDWLLVRLRQLVEAAKEEDWETITALIPVVDKGLSGFESEQRKYNEGTGSRGTYCGGKRYG